MSEPSCPSCTSEHTYELNDLLVCSMCAHEWSAADSPEEGPPVIRDAVGNVLADGDTVTVVKALKVKGSASGIKAGTKVRNIRLVAGVSDHDIDCKVDGIGAMQLKSSVVKKLSQAARAVVRDCGDNGWLDRRWTLPLLKSAPRRLPTDMAGYSDCPQTLRAELRARRRER